MQTDLFGHNKPTKQEFSFEKAKEVNGLRFYPDFIDHKTEKSLMEQIDNSQWLNDLKRRVQHYGFKYDYKARKIDNSFYLGQLPNWLIELANSICNKGFIDFIPDQAIINEYNSGQGIAPHIDCEPCFVDTIISLSIGSSCIMNFEKERFSKNKTEIFIEPRTLLIMKGESRYKWYHGIAARKSDKYNGEKIKRNRRISIIFRKTIIE